MDRLPDFPWPQPDPAIAEILQQMSVDGSWGQYHGPHCPKLIDRLKDFHDLKHVSLCSSGTSAVELALRAAGVAPGDEVVLSAYDYKANFSNVVLLNAKPVLIDVEKESLSPTVEHFEEAITKQTRAIIVSHLHGWVAPVAAIRRMAAEHGVAVIEDACQVPGATVDGQMAGAVGDVGVLSFGGSKLLTAGRGGAVMTNDSRLAQRLRLYTQRGNDAYPLSEMQAAVLVPQLDKLKDRNTQRAVNVRFLCECWPEMHPLQPVLRSNAEFTAFFKLPFRISDDAVSRETVIDVMHQLGVPIAEAFPALHRIHARSRFRTVGSLTNSSHLHTSLMTLHHPVLLQDESILRALRGCLINQST